MSQPVPSAMTLDELAELREKTERVSSLLLGRLRGHLDTLYPLIAPRRVFGKYVGARDNPPRVEEAYTHLAERFREAASAPFDIRSDLDEQALSAMEYGIDIVPWEYQYEVNGKPVTITSPVRWLVTYKADLSPTQVRNIAAGRAERKPAPLRQFIANALGLQIVVARTEGLTRLLDDLRYDLRTEAGPGLGKLTFLTIGCRVPSFRPADQLIASAIRFSGVPAFIELVDPDAVSHLEDPLRAKVQAILEA